jgi:hypothetical protein
MKRTATAVALALVLLLSCAACARQAAGGEISRERAIEIARQHLDFEAKSVEAVRATDQDRPVWQVTFRGESPSQVHMGEFLVVNIDRKTGELVSIGMS